MTGWGGPTSKESLSQFKHPERQGRYWTDDVSTEDLSALILYSTFNLINWIFMTLLKSPHGACQRPIDRVGGKLRREQRNLKIYLSSDKDGLFAVLDTFNEYIL